MTFTPVDTAQHCSPCPLNPEMPADVLMRLESNEGKMDPELKELELPLAGTDLEPPGRQCLPNDGTWGTGRTTADGFLTADVGSNQGGNISSPTERVDTRTGTKSTTTCADIIFLQQGHEPKYKEKGSEENKPLDPGGKREKAPLWNAAVTLFFLGKALGHGRLLACASCFLSVLCLCLSALFVNLLFFSGDHFSAS